MNPTPGKTYERLRDALAWRVRHLAGDQLVDRTIVKTAQYWRPLLKKPVFVGIAGSVGKTTTKELLQQVLSRKGQCMANPASLNAFPEVAKTVLRVRPGHNFCVAELSEDRPGVLDAPLALLQPSIGIVTVAGNDHLSAFGSREAIASEMGKLVMSLPATGTAILNADDELVLAMADRCAAKVITYGISPKADLRAEDISSVWPDRLTFTLSHGNDRVNIQTRLCGTHWLASVLGAIGGGLATGMTLQECAEGIASVAPFDGRMQPVTTPDGVTFIRDDFKAPFWTIGTSLEFMRAARAARKIMVFGELSNVGASKEDKYGKIAMLAQGVADVTIFVGPWASSALKARRPGGENALRVFSHVRDAASYLNSITRDGDLVLLKGTNKQDHLLRIIMARTGGIACWRDDCQRNSLCNECADRNKPSGLPLLTDSVPIQREAFHAPLQGQRTVEPEEQVIVGLGNPEPRYAGTPHNIGYEVVDRLAESMGLTWEATPDASIARGNFKDRRVCLVKINMAMNLIGAGLKQLSENMLFDAGQCILVFDDLALPLATVRTRLNGGAGGHRGVASILEAFQTDAFRRVKLGVDQAGARLGRVEYVLNPFDGASRAAVDQAIPIAAARIVEMVERASAAGPQ